MPVLSSCLCCSLLTASLTTAIMSAFLYCLAFALELWMLVETDVSLSVPAYILTIGYLLMSVLSLALVVSLRTKWSKVLLAWLLMMVIYIFPEAGLVLFMSIYHWGGETYGIIEISLWLIRIVFNLCGLLCVQSLWRLWREEKEIFRSLQELGSADLAPGLQDNKLRASLRYNNFGLGYHNPAFHTSINHLSGTALSFNKYNNKINIKRSASAASQLAAASRQSMPDLTSLSTSLYFPHHLKQGLSRNEFNPGGVQKTLSQYDLPSFGLDPDAPIFIQQGYGPGGLPGVSLYRGNSRRDHLISETMESYRPRSLSNLHREDSLSVSMLSERFNTTSRTDYDTQSLDRRRFGYKTSGLNFGYIPDTSLGYVSDNGAVHSYGGSLGSKQSLGQISGMSDSPEKYRDIAL